jgi:quercetin dioxygenase-like cupin family protein
MKRIQIENADSYEPEADWERRALAGSETMSTEWFTKPPGHKSPMHDHENEQVCVVLQGELTTYTEDEEMTLHEFDSVWLEPWETHSVENTGDEMAIGLDIFAPGRSFDYWLDGDH